LAALAPAAPEGAGTGSWLGGVCADWGCGASGNESSCFWLAVLDWLDWGGLAKRGISLEIRNAPANMAIEKLCEHLRPVRFILRTPKFFRLARQQIFRVVLYCNLGIGQRFLYRIENGHERRNAGYFEEHPVDARTRDEENLRIPARHLRHAL
jgi:hypothetical protein